MKGWKPIKGETPLDDISGFLHLKQFPNPTRDLVNGLEAENIRQAIVKYLARKPSKRTAPFTYEWLLRLHREMFGDVWRWAGALRTTQTNIGDPPQRLMEALQALLINLRHWQEQGDPIIQQAAMLHHTAVKIHPFPNGNGRWARMLANIWLKQNGQPVTAWPGDLETLTESRDEYLAAVRKADGMDYAPLIEIHKRYTDLR